MLCKPIISLYKLPYFLTLLVPPEKLIKSFLEGAKFQCSLVLFFYAKKEKKKKKASVEYVNIN